MRVELDGKAYVEHYVQTLTHELKSPLAGIRAAAELLQAPVGLLQTSMTEEQRQKFIRTIDSVSLRLQQLIERLLNLARVEQQQTLHEPKLIPVNTLTDELIQSQSARIAQQHIHLHTSYEAGAQVVGEYFLVHQALANLLDNALEFTPANGEIWLHVAQVDNILEISITNQGEPIPEFAFARLTERFFSLPRPATGKKSTGLGLSFVQEVMNLHRGKLELRNTQEGVTASLYFPAL
jgi:two-component system sensor histidine kinase CreC